MNTKIDKNWFNDMYQNEDTHWWFVSRRKIFTKILCKYFVKNNTKNKSKILEVGCGTGGNLEFLSHYGQLYAMEPNFNARKMAAARKICDINDYALPNAVTTNIKFDLICALDVLEYVDNDLEGLMKLREMLAINGLLLISLPAHNFLWSYHDTAVGNKRRYSKSDLLNLAKKCNLKLIYISYFNTFLFPIIFLIRIFNKIVKFKNKNDVNKTSDTANFIFEKFFSSEMYFIPRFSFKFGVSLVAVMKKEIIL